MKQRFAVTASPTNLKRARGQSMLRDLQFPEAASA